jgi:hypothetical protein
MEWKPELELRAKDAAVEAPHGAAREPRIAPGPGGAAALGEARRRRAAGPAAAEGTREKR